MLAAGRSLPAGAAARRAASAKSVLVSKSAAARCCGLGIRTLSSESTPGTVAGARAAASAGASSGSSGGGGSGGSGGAGGGGGGGGGGGSGIGAAATRLAVAATVVVGMDMIAYAKIPIVKDAVDNYLSGPLPPEVYDIYRRCGVDVAYPPGKGRPTREAWDFGISRKVAEKARRLSPFSSGDKDAKPSESKAGGYELEATSGLNKSFSISTPPWSNPSGDSEISSTPLSTAEPPTAKDPAVTEGAEIASSVETPAAPGWQNGAVNGAPDAAAGSGSGGGGDSTSPLDFIGVDAGAGGAVEAVQEKAEEVAGAVTGAWSTGEEESVLEAAEKAAEKAEEAMASEASRLSEAAASAAEAAGSAAEQAEGAVGSALAAASSVVSAAAGAAGDALTSSTEALKSVATDVVGSSDDSASAPEAGEGGGGGSGTSPEEAGSQAEEGADEQSSVSSASPMAAALKEKEEREAAVREEMESKKRRIRNEALSSVAEEMEVASAGMKRELEQSMLKDLKDLDEDSLRFRVAQLATELQERTKWEALRLMDGVQKKEAEIAQKYEALLSEQKEMYDTETGRALREQEQELSTAFIQKYGEQLRLHLENQANEFREALHLNAVASRETLEQELGAKHADEVAELKQQEIANSERVVAELRELSQRTEAKIMEIEAARSAEEEDRIASDRVHRVTHATLSLAERFASSAPIKKELDNLRRLAGGDELLEAAAGSIPEEAAAKGIPTFLQLKQRFGVVKAECRRAALVPEQAGNGMVGQLVASTLSKLTFAPKGMVEGGGAEGVLARADYLLEAGELESAVGELQKLDGLPADVAVDWLKDAKTRLTADEALRVIRCHASILNAKYLKGVDGRA